MQFPSITAAALLFPLLALAADSSTTTLTSTATMTRTITISEVVASVTSTYSAGNTTTWGPTAVGTTSKITATPTLLGGASGSLAPAPTTPGGAASTSAPGSIVGLGAASSLNSMYAGSAAMAVMVIAAFA